MTLSVKTERYETVLGLCYLFLQFFVLEPLFVFLNAFLKLSAVELNFFYFTFNFICICGIFHKFLIRSFRVVLRQPRCWLKFSGFGLLINFGCMQVIGTVIALALPDFVNPNNANVGGMISENPLLMVLATVVFVPFAEELLFRGVIFRSLHKKNRILAYAVSMLVFAIIHVAGYRDAGAAVLILSFFQYLPAGFALAFAYEKADTIWAPILIHATINLIANLSTFLMGV